MKLRIGSRGSELALTQSRSIQAMLGALPGAPETEICVIKTSGDLIQNIPLADLAGTPDERKGFFTKEIEEALLRGEVDLAVHSYKDLPTRMPPGLVVGAMPARVVAHDVLVFPRARQVTGHAPFLANGARIGTSAVRRLEQLRFRFPELALRPIRGNVPTRIHKLRAGDYDGIVLAAAGIERLRAAGVFAAGVHAGLLDGLAIMPLEPPTLIPAPAQGALAVECRAGDETVLRLLRQIHDASAARSVDAERAVLGALEGGCNLPLGVACRPVADGTFELSLFLGADAPDNRRGQSFHIERAGRDPGDLAQRVIEELRADLPVVVTGRADRMDEVAAELGEIARARLIRLPLIETLPLPVNDLMRAEFQAWSAAAGAPDRPAAGPPVLAVMSSPGIAAFSDFAQLAGPVLPADLIWAVNGPRTAAHVRARFPDARITLESPDGTGEGLAREILRAGAGPVLCLAAERGRPEFEEILTRAGVAPRILRLYRTVGARDVAGRIRDLPRGAFVIFGSPSAVETFFDAGDPSDAGFRFCALGPTTARALVAAGQVPYAVAARPDYTEFVRALF